MSSKEKNRAEKISLTRPERPFFSNARREFSHVRSLLLQVHSLRGGAIHPSSSRRSSGEARCSGQSLFLGAVLAGFANELLRGGPETGPSEKILARFARMITPLAVFSVGPLPLVLLPKLALVAGRCGRCRGMAAEILTPIAFSISSRVTC